MTMNGGQFGSTYEYNDDGIRTSKTASGVRHEYYLAGSQIEAEAWGNHLCVYLYDAEGAPIGMQYRTASMSEGQFYSFWFEKNLQGDIVAVYTENGTKIGSYTYDAWGVCTASMESGTTTLQKQIVRTYNPFRYRGYYYDTDTSLYYLQSRYYNPQWGRFLNADGQLNPGIIGNNMFAYCNNNPVLGRDDNGKGWIGAIIGGAVGAAVGAGFGALTAFIKGENIAAGAIAGAVNGGLCGAIVGCIAEDIATDGISSVAAIQTGIRAIYDSMHSKKDTTPSPNQVVEVYN